MFDEYLTEKAEQMLKWTEPRLGQMMLGSVKRISSNLILLGLRRLISVYRYYRLCYCSPTYFNTGNC